MGEGLGVRVIKQPQKYMPTGLSFKSLPNSRALRASSTLHEIILWSRLKETCFLEITYSLIQTYYPSHKTAIIYLSTLLRNPLLFWEFL